MGKLLAILGCATALGIATLSQDERPPLSADQSAAIERFVGGVSQVHDPTLDARLGGARRRFATACVTGEQVNTFLEERDRVIAERYGYPNKTEEWFCQNLGDDPFRIPYSIPPREGYK